MILEVAGEEATGPSGGAESGIAAGTDVVAGLGWQAVGFALGELDIVPRDREEDLVGYLGPDPLGPDWDRDEALRRLTADLDRPIGLALLDQRDIAGLGNDYRNEILFLRGVLPDRSVGDTDAAAVLDLVRSSHSGQPRSPRTHHHRGHPARPPTVGRAPGSASVPEMRDAHPRGTLGEDALTERMTWYCPRCQT